MFRIFASGFVQKGGLFEWSFYIFLVIGHIPDEIFLQVN